MKLELDTRWLRVLIELFPDLVPIRRYRALRPSLEGPAARHLCRRIARQLRRPDLHAL
ncbi:MAG: hypothetical protein AB9869_15565 [Verrucomicrobiia bacterium]